MLQNLKDWLPVTAVLLAGLSITVGIAEGPIHGGSFVIAGAVLIGSLVVAFAIEKR